MKKSLLFLLGFSLGLVIAQAQPKLSFFNEMGGENLKNLFSDTTLIPTLVKLKAEVRMGILDLSVERAEVLKRLNKAGVPVVAWLLLPEEKGYWFHLGNGKLAAERYEEIKRWADNQEIKFKGIGLDLEVNKQEVKDIQNNQWGVWLKMVGRLYNKKQIDDALSVYKKLVQKIKKDGFPVESYYIPFIKDEVKNGASALQQFTGILDLPTEKEIPMLYTSFTGNATGLLKIYALDEKVKYPALGSTGGGVDTTLSTLKWEDLARDLRIVAPIAEEIHIFSLEGAVKKGFLKKLIDFDYKQSVKINAEEVKNVETIRSRILLISNILSYPSLVITLCLVVVGLFLWLAYKISKWLIKSGFKFFIKKAQQ
jgi:hypothetical protein